MSHAAGGLGDWPDVVAGERAELLRALRSTDEPAVVTDVDEADDVALAQLQLVGVARTVVEQREQSTQQQQQAAAVLAAQAASLLQPRRIFPVVHSGSGHASKIASSPRGSGSPSNTWFLRLTRVHAPNGLSIGSAAHMLPKNRC